MPAEPRRHVSTASLLPAASCRYPGSGFSVSPPAALRPAPRLVCPSPPAQLNRPGFDEALARKSPESGVTKKAATRTQSALLSSQLQLRKLCSCQELLPASLRPLVQSSGQGVWSRFPFSYATARDRKLYLENAFLREARPRVNLGQLNMGTRVRADSQTFSREGDSLHVTQELSN